MSCRCHMTIGGLCVLCNSQNRIDVLEKESQKLKKRVDDLESCLEEFRWQRDVNIELAKEIEKLKKK